DRRTGVELCKCRRRGHAFHAAGASIGPAGFGHPARLLAAAGSIRFDPPGRAGSSADAEPARYQPTVAANVPDTDADDPARDETVNHNPGTDTNFPRSLPEIGCPRVCPRKTLRPGNVPQNG